MGIKRAESIARAREFIKKGISASRWIADMKELGISYRRTDMLADYRDTFELEKKKELWRYVRKGYVPTERTAEIKAWDMSKEYMYKVRCQRLFAGVPEEKPTFINIMHDTPQTIEAIEQEAWEFSFSQSPAEVLEERLFVVETFVHRMRE